MPRLWNETIDAHRRSVRDAIIDSTADLIQEHGILALTMSQIAKRAGISRATLYNYFTDAQATVTAWHQRQLTDHLSRLTSARDAHTDPGARLEAVIHAFADVMWESRPGHHHAVHAGLAATMHAEPHTQQAHDALVELLCAVLEAAAAARVITTDVPSDELARFCVHSLRAAADATTQDAAARVARLTLLGLRTTLTESS